MKVYLFLIGVMMVFLLLAPSCNTGEPDEAEYTLRKYIKDNGDPVIQLDTILAFACEAIPGYMENTGRPISVFFYPPENGTDFRYFETKRVTTNVNDLTTYYEKTFELKPEYNGYLMRFLHEGMDFPRWARISCKKDSQIYISTPVSINNMSDSTELFPGLVFIDFSIPTQPRFTWYSDTIPGTSIYFQIVSDPSDNLLSGTFTYDKYFHFYFLSNVVRNIRDVVPHPVVDRGQTYRFTLMGMDQDHWGGGCFRHHFSNPVGFLFRDCCSSYLENS